MHDAAVRIMAQDDVPEFLGGLQAALDVQLKRHEAVALLCADGSGRGLNVLRFHRLRNVGRGYLQSGHLDRVQPNPHGVLFQRHHLSRGNAFHAHDRVLHILFHVVVQLHLAQRGFVRHEGVFDQHAAVAFRDGDALSGHVRGQHRVRLLDRVLQVHHCDIRVGPALERDCAFVRAVVAACRGEVQQVFHAVDLVFDRHGDRLCDHLATCAGIGT